MRALFVLTYNNDIVLLCTLGSIVIVNQNWDKYGGRRRRRDGCFDWGWGCSSGRFLHSQFRRINHKLDSVVVVCVVMLSGGGSGGFVSMFVGSISLIRERQTGIGSHSHFRRIHHKLDSVMGVMS